MGNSSSYFTAFITAWLLSARSLTFLPIPASRQSQFVDLLPPRTQKTVDLMVLHTTDSVQYGCSLCRNACTFVAFPLSVNLCLWWLPWCGARDAKLIPPLLRTQCCQKAFPAMKSECSLHASPAARNSTFSKLYRPGLFSFIFSGPPPASVL